MIHLDTTFLIDAIRESRQGTGGPARTWLAANQGAQLAISLLVLCELLVGAELHGKPEEERSRVRKILRGLPTVLLDEQIPAIYASTAAQLIRNGDRIATMDLLVACVALANGAALLTRNVRHFNRVPGLEVLDY